MVIRRMEESAVDRIETFVVLNVQMVRCSRAHSPNKIRCRLSAPCEIKTESVTMNSYNVL